MKIITVAAGAGVRLASASPPVPRPQKLGQMPKAMYPVASRPIVAWSASIYEEWLAAGLVDYSDFIFVVQEAHDRDFQIVDHIKTHVHSDVTFKTIPELSSGPAATAMSAISELEDSEGILINDCDHYFSSSGLMKSLMQNCQQEPDVLIATTDPHNTIPTWSYAILEKSTNPRLQAVQDIREKDPELASAGAPGVIGAYYFKSAKLFRDLYEETFSNFDGEKYVSHVIRHALDRGCCVMAAKSSFGYPLGTSDEIELFKAALVQKKLNQKSNNYFINLDVLFGRLDFSSNKTELKHKDNSFNYAINELRALELRHLYQTGNTILLYSDIPDIFNLKIVDLLNSNQVFYDNLLLGVSSGTSALFASSKNVTTKSDPVMGQALNEFSNAGLTIHPTISGHLIARDMTSGSGAITVRLLDEFGKSFVRKYCSTHSSPQNEKIIDVLKLQANWLVGLKGRFATNVPEIIQAGVSGQYFCLDMEDLGDLPTIYRLVSGNECGEVQKYDLLEKLLELMGSIYSDTSTGHYAQDDGLVVDLILNRAIPALNLLFNSANISSHQLASQEVICINDRQVENPLKKLSRLVGEIESGDLSIGGVKADLFCTIHGDLTAENVLVKDSLIPMLIDPLAATMDLSAYDEGVLVREKSSPFFDYLKLMQSFSTSYEKWDRYERPAEIDESNKIWYNKTLYGVHNAAVDQVRLFYQSIGVDTGIQNTSLMLAVLLLRIIPYKIQLQQSQALMCFCIAAELLEEV